QAYTDAHYETLPAVAARPDTPSIPPGQWVKVREAPRPPEPSRRERRQAEKPEKPVPLLDEKYYWSVVGAYRGRLDAEALRGLVDADPLLARRLKSADPSERGINQFFAGVADKDHRTLLTTGRVEWKPERLTKDQRKALEPVVRGLNDAARTAGEATVPYSLDAYSGTTVGLAVVVVPDVEKPMLSWWIRSPSSPTPAWVPLVNSAARNSPLYYRAHLEQLGGR
ncbi:MAG TPA: hypothetical protein VK689_08160, partial [Armatimonadota bacterium]|nr:hypothetical protein [Armatimonadota bacterium]